MMLNNTTQAHTFRERKREILRHKAIIGEFSHRCEEEKEMK